MDLRGIVLALCFVAACSAKKFSEPACEPDMKNGCPRSFEPVCGSNDKTYANLCELCVKSYSNKESGQPGLQIKHNGECNDGEVPLNDEIPSHLQRKADCARFGSPIVGCTKELNPVCGSNDRTYANECLLCIDDQNSITKILVKHPGSCRKTSS